MNTFFISFFSFFFHLTHVYDVQSKNKVSNKSIRFLCCLWFYFSLFVFLLCLSGCLIVAFGFVFQIPNKIHTYRNTKKSLNNVLIEPLETFMANSLLNLTSAENIKSISLTIMVQTASIIGISKL